MVVIYVLRLVSKASKVEFKLIISRLNQLNSDFLFSKVLNITPFNLKVGIRNENLITPPALCKAFEGSFRSLQMYRSLTSGQGLPYLYPRKRFCTFR